MFKNILNIVYCSQKLLLFTLFRGAKLGGTISGPKSAIGITVKILPAPLCVAAMVAALPGLSLQDPRPRVNHPQEGQDQDPVPSHRTIAQFAQRANDSGLHTIQQLFRLFRGLSES